MKYMLLIHQGSTPLPGTPEWDALSPEEQGQVFAGYQALNEAPGVVAGERMAGPDSATTVRVADGQTLTTDGPYAELKDAVGGYCFLEADDLDAAIEVAALIPAARMGGGVEVRPMMGS
jgi:hypothetical protein